MSRKIQLELDTEDAWKLVVALRENIVTLYEQKRDDEAPLLEKICDEINDQLNPAPPTKTTFIVGENITPE